MEKMKAKKTLGQHFLCDHFIIERIVTTAQVQPTDHILEIGPGTGILTEALAKTGAQVLAVELDSELVSNLNMRFVASENVSIVEGNILDIHLEEWLKSLGYAHQGYKVVANIPYYITAPIIRSLLSLASQPSMIVLMVQDEVADRLAAQPGSMSVLSVMAQYYSEVEKCFVVSRNAFDPVPLVESAVIRFVPNRRFDTQGDRRLFRVVKAGFSARRKTLANNVTNAFHIERTTIEQILATLQLSPMIRAQELSIAEWQALSQAIFEQRISDTEGRTLDDEPPQYASVPGNQA